MLVHMKAAGPGMWRLVWGALAASAIYGAGFVHGAGLRSLPDWIARLL